MASRGLNSRLSRSPALFRRPQLCGGRIEFPGRGALSCSEGGGLRRGRSTAASVSMMSACNGYTLCPRDPRRCQSDPCDDPTLIDLRRSEHCYHLAAALSRPIDDTDGVHTRHAPDVSGVARMYQSSEKSFTEACLQRGQQDRDSGTVGQWDRDSGIVGQCACMDTRQAPVTGAL
eukprot:5742410-Pyramimonas_sp.AAC.1